jgi:hypothetical protein
MKTSYRQQENEGDTRLLRCDYQWRMEELRFSFPDLEGRRRELLRVVKKKNKIRISQRLFCGCS